MRKKDSYSMPKFYPLAGALVIFLLAGSLISRAEETRVTSMVDRQTVHQNEEVQFTIRVSEAKGNIPAPPLPNFPGFDTFYSGRASHFTFINGRSASTIEFNYVLVPQSVGVFEIPPVAITISGETYQSDPIHVEVLGQFAPTPAPPPRSNSKLAPQTTSSPSATAPPVSGAMPDAFDSSSSVPDDNIFLRVTPSKRTVYSNEQLLLTYSLLTRYDTRYEGFETEPETSGFWVEEFPMERDLGKQTEIINGKKYVRADVRKTALFPTAPGEYVIKPGSAKVSVQIEQQSSNFLDEFFNDSFFSNAGIFARRVDKVLSVAPITIVVKPIPETGKPASFNGAVGNFHIETSVDKRVVKQNEPVAYRFVVEGEGNIETLSHPAIPEIPDIKMFDSDTKSEFLKSEQLMSGRKTFEVILIPKTAGTLEIPSLEFSFFNPRSEQYVTLRTDSYSIKVEPSLTPEPVLPAASGGEELASAKKEVQVVGKDIRYIHEKIRTLPKRNTAFRFFAWINGLLTLVWIGWFIRQRRNEVFGRNVALKRDRFAKRNAQAKFRRLVRMAKKAGDKQQKHFFDEADRLMDHYLADKLNVSPQGFTLRMAVERLAEKGTPKDVIQKIERYYDMSGLARFGGTQGFRVHAHEAMDAIESILKDEL